MLLFQIKTEHLFHLILQMSNKHDLSQNAWDILHFSQITYLH